MDQLHAYAAASSQRAAQSFVPTFLVCHKKIDRIRTKGEMMGEFLTTVIFSTSAAGIFSGVIIWLSKSWLSERIKKSIEHEYDKKFQDYKSKLDLETQKQVFEFRNNIEKDVLIQTVGNKSLEEINKVSMTKKVAAIDAVWAAVLALRSIFPPIAGMIDALPPDKVDLYRALKQSPDYELIKGRAASDQFKKTMTEKVNLIEGHRIYLGEYVWSLYHAIMVIMIMFYTKIHLEQDDQKVITWYEEDIVKGFVKTIFDPEELKWYESRNFGKQWMIREVLEKKILNNLRLLVSAEKVTEESLRLAKQIEAITKKMSEQVEAQSGRRQA